MCEPFIWRGRLSLLTNISGSDTMYFTGYRGTLCGYPESCIFRYDERIPTIRTFQRMARFFLKVTTLVLCSTFKAAYI